MSERSFDTTRSILIEPHSILHAEGSSLITCGNTKVICTASVEDRMPPWLSNKGRGWVTAEYDMLPRATHTRKMRDAHKGKINGRTQEISRLIGRALRAVVDTTLLGERLITIDCDVIQADGGTRTAAINGGYVALALAIQRLIKSGEIKHNPLKNHVAAISAGIIDGKPYLDLDYNMDSRALVDMNIVMTGSGEFIEIQGTGEGHSFSRSQLDALLDLALAALPSIVAEQTRAVAFSAV